MSLALAHSRARTGVLAPEVRVEVHLAPGLPALHIVGLPAAAVRESRDRVRAAIHCAQLAFPDRRITVNLAPADLPKDGGRFDLPIAIGILAASGLVRQDALGRVELLGELALTGELRTTAGVLPAALAAAAAGRALIVPAGNGAEAALAQGVEAYVARTLLEVVAHINGLRMLPRASALSPDMAPAAAAGGEPDLADVRGQHHARRALEVAAAGGHHLFLWYPITPRLQTLARWGMVGTIGGDGDVNHVSAGAEERNLCFQGLGRIRCFRLSLPDVGLAVHGHARRAVDNPL